MRGFLQTGIVAAVFGLVGMCGGCNPTTSTVEGGTLTVGIDGDKVTLTDENGATVNIVDTDVAADNGVIHVIDTVLTVPKAGKAAAAKKKAE